MDEEKIILDLIMSQRHKVMSFKKEMNELKFKLAEAEAIESEYEKAMIDYMAGNGLKKTEVGDISVTLGESTSVDINDIDSVPERYIKTKEIKEINKALIKAEGLESNNWLSYSTKPFLKIKNKHT